MRHRNRPLHQRPQMHDPVPPRSQRLLVTRPLPRQTRRSRPGPAPQSPTFPVTKEI